MHTEWGEREKERERHIPFGNGVAEKRVATGLILPASAHILWRPG